MAGLTDEEFLDMKPPAQAGKALSDDEFLSAKPGVLSNRGTDEGLLGYAKNAATSVAAGLSHVPGLSGDLVGLGDLVGSGVASLVPGEDRTSAQIAEDWKKGRAERGKAAAERVMAEPKPWWMPDKAWENRQKRTAMRMTSEPPTGQDIYQKVVKPVLGEYEPQTTAGRYGRAFLESAVPTMLLPGAGLATGALGGLGGVGGQAGSDVSGGNPYAALAGSFVVPGVASVGRAAGHRYIGPQTKAGVRNAVGKQYTEDFTNPEKALTNVQEGLKAYENSPLEPPSFAELAKDQGAAQSEVATRLTDPRSAAALQDRQAARNEARTGAMEGIPSALATGEEPGALFRQHLEDLDKQTEQALPNVGTNEEVGARTRAPASEGRDKAAAETNRLFDTFEEKYGDVPLTTPVTKANATRLNNFDPAFEEGPTSTRFIDKALAFPDTVTFGQLRGYLKSINKALSKARSGGDQTNVDIGELKFLKRGIHSDMENAVSNMAKHEDEAVANGQMDPDATFAKTIQRQRDEFLASRKMAESGSGTGGPGAAGTLGDNGANRAAPTEGQKPAGPSGAGGDGAVPGSNAEMGAEAAAALKAANAARVYVGKTYQEGTPGKLLATNKFGTNWKVTDSAVPREAFPGGPDGYTITKSVLDMAPGDPKMAGALKDTAIMTLRSEAQKNGGILKPEALQKWKNKYQTSLNALDEVHPGFSKQFDNLANTQSEMAAKFAGHTNVSEAVDAMGDILRRRDAPTVLGRLVNEADGEPMVREGIKKLIIDHMMDASTKGAGMSGDLPTMRGGRFRDLLGQYKPALEQSNLFTPQHLKLMDTLAKDFESEQQHTQNLKGPLPGSPTAGRLTLLKQRLADPTPTEPTSSRLGRAGVGALLISGQYGAAAAAASSLALDSLVGKMKARSIKSMNDLYRAGITDTDLGVSLLRHGLEQVGSESWARRVGNALSDSPLYAQPGLEDAEKKREGRASGGKVGVDHAKAAAHLVGLVEKARKSEQAKTKPLLGAHDTTVARALELANRAI